MDKLDIWMMAVLAMTLLTVRVWRLGEPYQMHFDEVYHPRTAIEFLQDWRYGISHDIYEWTHPHLAKYAMAGGIVAWGNDRTTATSELGAPVTAAVVEPRWDERTTASQRAGDRLWLVTGGAVRAYDLATRSLIVEVTVPGAQTLAIDRVAHRLLVGTTDGEIRAIDTTFLDFARQTGSTPETGSVVSTPLVKLDASPEYLLVTPDGGTIVAVTASAGAGGGSDAIVLDATSGSEVGRVATGAVSAIAEAGIGSVALAVPQGVAFLDTATVSIPTTIRLSGVPTGMAFTTNLDKDRLYVSYLADDGPHVATVNAPGTGGTPSLDVTFVLPGADAGWVAYDLATQMVHVLGSRPDTGEPTVYVIEPHSRAVYADAALPFSPTALVLDVNQRYPSSDREQLLAFSAAGSIASVDVGHHAYAWRLPGVLAGIAMAVLLYLLARILFRRREVAVILGFLIAVDGMLFAQSRIGMNDAYVGLGIVAAYVLFAAIWKSGASRWRWLAFWVAMPAIGVALGFALAAKWVAIYAIGALGILVLARSALGRLLLIGGLILATTVLGYLGLSVPAGESGGNYLFISLMIALTLVASTAVVLHPIAWSDEEERLLVWGPAAIGGAVLAVAIAVGAAGHEFVLGPIKVTPIEAAFGLVAVSGVIYTLVHLIGRIGFGPKAVAPSPSDPARFLPTAVPAPDGWLRPGAMLGLPMAWIVICLVAIPLGRVRGLVHPVGERRGSPALARLAAGTRRGKTLWDLTQEMYRYHNNLSSPHAASSPWWAWPFDFKPVWFYQAELRRRDGGGDLRRRQPRGLVDRHPGHGLRRLAGVRSTQSGAGPDRDRVRLPVARLVAHRPGGLPVPLLHEPAVRVPRPRLLPGRGLARCFAPHMAPDPPGRGRGRPRPDDALAPAPAAVCVRPRGRRQSGFARLSNADTRLPAEWPGDGHRARGRDRRAHPRPAAPVARRRRRGRCAPADQAPNRRTRGTRGEPRVRRRLGLF